MPARIHRLGWVSAHSRGWTAKARLWATLIDLCFRCMGLMAIAFLLSRGVQAGERRVESTPGLEPAHAAPEEEISELYQVFPVTTDLQRRYLPPVRGIPAGVYVRMNGNVLPKVSDVEAMREELAPFAKKANSCVYFGVFYVGPLPDHDRQREFDKKLMDWSKEIGFRAYTVSSTYKGSSGVPDDWKATFLAIRKSQSDEPDGPETGIGNELVTVYPIRTRLSRVLTDNSDCRVELLQVVDGSSEPLTPAVRKAISQFVSQLALKQKRKILFAVKFVYGKEGSAAVETLHKDLSKFVHESLGFEDYSTNQTAVIQKPPPKQK
jgi:hypothetical protein